MSQRGFSIPILQIIISALLLISLGCSIKRGVESISDYQDLQVSDTKIFKGPGITNPPSDIQLKDMMNEAIKVMREVLTILEEGKCYDTFNSNINNDKGALEKWLEKTKPSQEKIGMLLREHPTIFCLSLMVRSGPFKEEAKRIKKGFEQFNIMWSVKLGEDNCLVIVFPTNSFVSWYGATTTSEKDYSLNIYLENIPKYYSFRIKIGQYPNFTEEDKMELNDLSLMETIIESHNPSRFEGEGSKGLLISFTKKVQHNGRKFWADGIRIYSPYNYDASLDKNPIAECPKDFYGKPYCICSTFHIPVSP